MPRARPVAAEPVLSRGGRRRTAARSSDGLTADRRCAILTVDRDLVIRSASGGLFRAFVDEDRSLVGRPVGAAVTPELAGLLVDHVTAAWRDEPTAVTVRTPRGDRTVELRFHAPRSREIGGACAIVAVDVTDEHEAAAVARELDAVLDAAVGSAFEPTGIIDTEGRWLRLNPPLQALLGYPEERLLGRAAADVTQIDDRSREAYLRDRAEQDGTASFELEKRMVRGDGGVIVVHARTTLVRDGDAIRGYVVHVVPDGVVEALPRPEPPDERPRRGLLRRTRQPGRGPGDAP
ncbi:unannotated protein [freshwater metagenome]|uniref:Unannotated protein n=1 Tax=freshwater metagenome TaxID=449393 RepID=A0A6J7HH69_9ZZZZ